MILIGFSFKRLGILCLLCVSACTHIKNQYSSVYTVDPNTVWQTIELTADGVHYGADMDSVSRNGPVRTVWLQIRSANSPYLYEKLQIIFHCVEKRQMLVLRTLIQDDQVIAIQHDRPKGNYGDNSLRPPFMQWRDIQSGSRDEKLLAKVCKLQD
jgi:hypothetical protein